MRKLGLVLLLMTGGGCGRTEPHRPLDWSELMPLTTDAGCVAVAVDTYSIPPGQRRPIDVLFVVDDSCSMSDDQRRLSSNMSSFFNSFQASQVDFHVGVITTDMKSPFKSGRLVARFLTHQTPNVIREFERMVLVGTEGSGDERGISAAYAAIRRPLSVTVNAGFIRPEADFALVFLTDEDDHGRIGADVLASEVRALKSDGAAITVGAILLDCAASANQWRYATFARLFGERGLISRCAQNYAGTLRTIAGRVVNRRCIVPLREPMDKAHPPTVTMNGGPTSWYYAPPEEAFSKGSIEVEPCPEGGGQLELTYERCDHL